MYTYPYITGELARRHRDMPAQADQQRLGRQPRGLPGRPGAPRQLSGACTVRCA